METDHDQFEGREVSIAERELDARMRQKPFEGEAKVLRLPGQAWKLEGGIARKLA